jgi:hypothetical protein
MAMGRRRHRLRTDVGRPLSHHRRVPFSGVTGASGRGPTLADRTEHEPSETRRLTIRNRRYATHALLGLLRKAILIGVRQAYYLQWTTIVVLPLLADTRLKNLMACDVASLIQPWLAFRPMEWPA